MMTRKHYRMIASNLAELRSDLSNYQDAFNYTTVFDRFVSHMCADLKADNPNFNSAKFREAVYED